ncbi:Pleiotropic drug resistance protein 3 [Camellia lanceoleosa]|uniref:Pleiotropic drug resistance protein 3 n=1 Tax=Camellia lanceoleosa TaxID=1840588 RepID=A0ACC0FFK4_9ERIC|nr:Pleiotropic drug resistance protein 3 [Camellia lanceoleosa]
MIDASRAVDVKSELVCIHDSARPLVTTGDVKKWLHHPKILYANMVEVGISGCPVDIWRGYLRVQKIRNNYNPATWMLEITSRSAEAQLCIDFAQVYKNCVLYQNNREHVNRWSTPPPDSFELNSQQGVFNPLRSIFSATIFLGINNSSSVLPYAATSLLQSSWA